MKKIGIVSFHVAINYGVYLQAYALQKKIEELGYDPIILDYRKRTDEPNNRIKKVLQRSMKKQLSIKEVLRDIKFILQKYKNSKLEGIEKRKKAFFNFANKNFKLTKTYENYESICQDTAEYAACVCGSDQIWNPLYTKCNPVYFLEFISSNKRIAYAPSIAISDIPIEYKKTLKRKINQFAFLSLREKSGALFWTKQLKRDIVNVVDPTLLYSAENWRKMALFPKEKHYVLCYFLGHSENYLKLINQTAETYQLKIIVLPFTNEAIHKYPGKKVYASIEEFLGYMNNADFVLTDSFHGTAFSVNFNRNFYVVKRADSGEKMHSRINDFLTNINLEKRVIEVENIENIILEKIDYTPVNIKLNSWIQNSTNYLENSLKNVAGS